MYSWSPNLSQLSLKNSFGKVIFQILAEIEIREMKIGYLSAILKRYKYFIFFSWNMVVISVYLYGVKMILKIPVGKWFSLGGFHGTPSYAQTEVRGTLCS